MTLAVLLGPIGSLAVAEAQQTPTKTVPPALNFTMPDIDGKPVPLSNYQGQVILIVNVASKCGLTPQYAALQKAYEQYRDKGFTVLAFPANDFLWQEPGSNERIKEFCTTKYHITFPMFAKSTVKGGKVSPLYQYLTSRTMNPGFGGSIQWNFTKFLINRKGEVVGRFKPSEDPASPAVVAAIEKELAAPRP